MESYSNYKTKNESHNTQVANRKPFHMVVVLTQHYNVSNHKTNQKNKTKQVKLIALMIILMSSLVI
jgi:hypothetical protein